MHSNKSWESCGGVWRDLSEEEGRNGQDSADWGRKEAERGRAEESEGDWDVWEEVQAQEERKGSSS